MTFLTTVLLVVLSISCASPDRSQPTLDEQHAALLGMWVMHKVFDDSIDVSSEHNPAQNRWIEFSEEGTFESGGAPFGYNSGKWVYDTDKQEIYLDSNAGEEDDSYWIVNLDQDSMYWAGARTEFARRFTLTFKKKGF